MFNLKRSNPNVATNPATSPETNKRLRFAPRSETETSLAAELMTCVLQPTPEHVERAKTIITAYPAIMFVETTGVEWASGVHNNQVKHRSVKCSSFEAAIGTGDREIYRYMAQYMENVVYKDENGEVIETGIQRALTQIQEKFPNGFDFPPLENKFNLLITKIVNAITNDESLKENNTPGEISIMAIKNLRKYCLPKEVTQGHHFNLNYLIEAINQFNTNHIHWPEMNQQNLFWCQVVGYLERLVTGVDAQALTESVGRRIEKNELLFRTLNSFDEKSLTLVPYFSTSSTSKIESGLGFDYAFNIALECSRASASVLCCYSAQVLVPLCAAKVSELNNFKQELELKVKPATVQEEAPNPVRNSFK